MTFAERWIEKAPEKEKNLLMETLERFQKEGFSQFEVSHYMLLLEQTVKESNGTNAFRSFLLDET